MRKSESLVVVGPLAVVVVAAVVVGADTTGVVLHRPLSMQVMTGECDTYPAVVTVLPTFVVRMGSAFATVKLVHMAGGTGKAW